MFYCINHDFKTPWPEIAEKPPEVFAKYAVSPVLCHTSVEKWHKTARGVANKKDAMRKTRAWRLEYLEPERITPTRWLRLALVRGRSIRGSRSEPLQVCGL